jgi:TP901 family phage tail tape measure protein
MSDTGGPVPVIEFGVGTDGSEEAMAMRIAAVFERVFSQIGKNLTDSITDALKNLNFKGVQFTDNLNRNFNKLADTIELLNRRSEALGKTLQGSLRAGPAAGAFDQAFRHLIDMEERLREISVASANARSEASRKALQEEAVSIRTRLRQEGSVLKSIADTERSAAAQSAAMKIAEERRVTATLRGEAGERVANIQREGAQMLAETRAANQRRVVIFQAAMGQIRALERGLGSAFSGTANAIGQSFNKMGSLLSTFAARFRRSSAEINDGFQPALTKREGLLRRSMSTQERIIQTSVTQQSAQLNRLEKQLSTGLAGAATGRSGIGLLTGGAAIGGGLGIAAILRNGITAGADFTQAMAVLDAQLQLTDSAMASVRQTSLDLGNDIKLPGVSALDAVQAIGLLSKQFGDLGANAAPAAEAAARGVLALSRATGASAEDSAQIVGSAVNVFGIAADQAGVVADKVATALSLAAGTSTQEFAQAFAQGAGVFNLFQGQALGAEGALVEFNAALAVLAKNGRVGSDAGNSLKQLFLLGTRNVDEVSAKTRELAEAVGLSGSVFYNADGSARAFSDSIDILRTATATMTQEQRDSTLALLFGADAVSTANALINTTAEEYDKLVLAMRRQNTAAELAAARNQGLRGAMDALSSTIETQLILAYEKVNVVAGNVVLAFANLFNNLAQGEGVFAVIRDGLKGVVIALGGLLVAKAAGEALQFLGIGLRAVLTPMGLFITAVAAIGAGIAIMRERSETFREITDSLATRLREGLGAAIEFVKVKIGEFADFIGPKLEEARDQILGLFRGGSEEDDLALNVFGVDTRNLGEKIGDRIRLVIPKIVEAFNAGREYLRGLLTGSGEDDDLALSVFNIDSRTSGEKMGDRIRQILGPVVDFLKRMAGTVREVAVKAFDELKQGIVSFWEVARGPLSAAADAIGRVASGVRNFAQSNPGAAFGTVGAGIAGALAGFALAGPLGAVVGGAGAAVGALFVNGFGDEIVAGLSAVGTKVGDKLKDIFTIDNAINVVGMGARLANTLGEAIGGFVSDPRVVSAVAGVAAAAVTIGASFVAGVAEGILNNIPKLASLIGDGLESALKSAFDAVLGELGTLITAGLGIAIGGAAIYGAFRLFGRTSRKAFEDGFKSGVPSIGGAGLGNNTRGFIDGLFGGNAGIDRDAARISKRFQAEFDRNNRILAANRVDTLSRSPLTSGELGQDTLNRDLLNSRAAIDDLENRLGKARVAGTTAAASIGSAFRSLGVRDIPGAARALGDLGATLKGQAKNIGAGLGTAVAAGLGVAFSAQMISESKGMGDTIGGILGIVGSAGAAAAVGGAPLAAIALALGGITYAFQQNQAAAEKAAAASREYADALRDVQGISAQAEAGGAVVLKNLAKIADGDVRKAFIAAGFDAEAFARRVIDGSSSAAEEFARFAEGLGGDAAKFGESIRADGVDSFREFLQQLEKGAPGADAFRARLEGMGLKLGEFRGVINTITGEAGGLRDGLDSLADSEALAELAGKAGDAGGKMVDLRGAFGTLFEPGISQAELAEEKLRQVQEATDAALEGINDLFGLSLPSTLQQNIDDLIISIQGIPSSLADVDISTVLGRAQVGSGVTDFVNEFRDTITEAIQDQEISAVPQITVRKDEILAELTRALDADVGDEATEAAQAKFLIDATLALNQATLDPQFAVLLQQYITGQPPVETVLGIQPTAQIADPALFRQSIADAIAATGNTVAPLGFAGGGGATESKEIDVPITLNPQITVGSGATGGAAKAADAVVLAFRNALAGAMGGAIAVAHAGSIAVGDGFGFGGKAAFTSGAQLAGQFTRGLAGGIGGAVAAARFLGAAASNAVSSSSKAAYAAGLNIAQGLTNGINAGAGAAIKAAQRLANAVAQAARSALQIDSPSKVFYDIGTNIGQGLANGLADQENSVSDAVGGAMDAALKTAEDRMRLFEGVASASAQLFGQMVPSGTSGGPSDAANLAQFAGISQIGRQLRQFLDEQAVELFESVGANAEGSANFLQRSIVDQLNTRGIGNASFDANSILGGENTQQFLQAGQQIRDYGQALLESGASVDVAVGSMQALRNEMVAATEAVGANQLEINALLHVLGLTQPQLGEFIAQVNALNAAAGQPGAAPASKEAEDRAREEAQKAVYEAQIEALKEQLRVAGASGAGREIHVHVPYGDPEAVGLGVANRLAFDQPGAN